MSHNVQYLGIEEDPFVLAARFENVPLPDRTVQSFNSVRVKVDYKNFMTDETILSVFPGGWVEDESDLVHMRVGRPHCAMLAMRVRGVWSATEVIVEHKVWGTQYDLRSHHLPISDLTAVITLIADRGMSVEPQRFHLSVETNGRAKVWHLPPTGW